MPRGKKDNSSLVRERRRSSRPAGGKEKRYYIRIDISVPVTLGIKKKEGLERAKASVRNISASGMMMDTKKKLPVGTETEIEMSPPGALNPIHCDGKITRVKAADRPGRYNCGVIFTSIEEDNKNTFLKFLCDAIYRTGEKQ